MKNIHILPTDQPTGIFETNSGLQFSLMNKVRHGEFKGFHIYITSDEEIKEGDWIHKSDNEFTRIEQSNFNGDVLNPLWKKITLTTDPTLIADGVQSIDDEFLEWFVKNPTCEFVEVDKIPDLQSYNEKTYKCELVYTITIPQEEPKQEKEEEYFKHLEKDKKEFAEEWEEIRQEFGFGKQETLEEAAEMNETIAWELAKKRFEVIEGYVPDINNKTHELMVSSLQEGIMTGAKWQVEKLFKDDAIQTLEKGLALLLKKQEGMYSEDEVRALIIKALTHNDYDLCGSLATRDWEIRPANFGVWFKHNKKR